jgi:hypothetical protein
VVGGGAGLAGPLAGGEEAANVIDAVAAEAMKAVGARLSEGRDAAVVGGAVADAIAARGGSAAGEGRALAFEAWNSAGEAGATGALQAANTLDAVVRGAVSVVRAVVADELCLVSPDGVVGVAGCHEPAFRRALTGS